MTRYDHIFKIIRSRCVSDLSAKSATEDLMKFLDSKCDCDNEETTGWVSSHNCNICGRDIEETKVKKTECSHPTTYVDDDNFQRCQYCNKIVD